MNDLRTLGLTNFVHVAYGRSISDSNVRIKEHSARIDNGGQDVTTTAIRNLPEFFLDSDAGAFRPGGGC